MKLPKRIDVTLVDLAGAEPVVLYRRLSWWRKWWRKLWA